MDDSALKGELINGLAEAFNELQHAEENALIFQGNLWRQIHL